MLVIHALIMIPFRPEVSFCHATISLKTGEHVIGELSVSVCRVLNEGLYLMSNLVSVGVV